MTDTKYKILLVEDDDMLSSGLVYALENQDYTVWHASDVKTAISYIDTKEIDLALLDMQLPDGTGFEVAEKSKQTGASIIFLTVVDDEGNIVKALEEGADDYITKPFRLQELLARIRTVLRRRSGKPAIITLGQVRVNTQEGKAYIGDELLDLTALEYRLLLTFASNKGTLLSRTQILENIWDSAGNFVEDNTLTVYIKRLREKLGGNASIETIRGMGYRADDNQ